MPILKQAVSGGIALAGPRGEARRLVSAVLTHVPTPLLSALPQRDAIDADASKGRGGGRM